MRGILIIFLVGLCLQSSLAEKLASFSGHDGREKTRTFQVEGPWELEWDFQGTALKVEIYHADNSKAVGNPIRQSGDGKGQASFQKPGAYFLEIKSVGDYTISVNSVDSLTGSLPVYSGGTERKGTPMITLPEGWGFRWKFEGAAFKLTLFDEQKLQVGSPVTVVGSGKGERVVDKAGKYFFMIQSSGNYRLELFQK